MQDPHDEKRGPGVHDHPDELVVVEHPRAVSDELSRGKADQGAAELARRCDLGRARDHAEARDAHRERRRLPKDVALPEAVPCAAEERAQPKGEESERPKSRIRDELPSQENRPGSQRVVGERGRRLVHAGTRPRCQRPTAIMKAANTQWKNTGIVGPWTRNRTSMAAR